jgi:hypothetical protein
MTAIGGNTVQITAPHLWLGTLMGGPSAGQWKVISIDDFISPHKLLSDRAVVAAVDEFLRKE